MGGLDAEDSDSDDPEAVKEARRKLRAREVLIELPPAAAASPATSPTVKPLRIGVACMTKKPYDLEAWLRHHHEHIGAIRFYLRVEETPELRPLLGRPPWATLVKARFAQRSAARDWQGQTSRQVLHVNDAIEWARDDALTHLLHLDDDELLYLPRGAAAFHDALRRLPPEVVNVHALTIEALAPSIGCTSPFAEVRCFKHRPAEYSSYGEAEHNAGKSLGVLRCPRLRCQGPHHFAKRAQCECESGEFDWSGTHVLPGTCAVVLHYESCTYERWLLKYTECAEHLRKGGERKQGFLFRFYCESLGACKRRLESRERGRPTAIEAAEETCRALWSRWKVQPEGLTFPPVDSAIEIDRARGLTLLPRPVCAPDSAAADSPLLANAADATPTATPPLISGPAEDSRASYSGASTPAVEATLCPPTGGVAATESADAFVPTRPRDSRWGQTLLPARLTILGETVGPQCRRQGGLGGGACVGMRHVVGECFRSPRRDREVPSGLTSCVKA
jgi:hypothetical protein